MRTLLLLSATLLACSAAAQTRGLVVSGETVCVVDAERAELLTSFALPGETLTECAVSSDGRAGFAATFLGDVLVLDLTLDPARIASAARRIDAPTLLQEIELAPDDAYLVGTAIPSVLGGFYRMVLIDVAAEAVVGPSFLQESGEVTFRSARELFTTSSSSLWRGVITEGPGGAALDPFVEQAPGNATRPTASPDGRWVVERWSPKADLVVRDATTLAVVSARPVASTLPFPSGGNVVFGLHGRRLFAETHDASGDRLSAHAFDPDTGRVREASWSRVLQHHDRPPDRIALDPRGRFLLVAERGVARELAVEDGTELAAFALPVTDRAYQPIACALSRPPLAAALGAPRASAAPSVAEGVAGQGPRVR